MSACILEMLAHKIKELTVMLKITQSGQKATGKAPFLV
jgi:hypothetical protein